MEIIQKIESFDGEGGDYGYNGDNPEHGYDGWRVTTDKQVIRIMVSNMRDCCEGWGYITSEDDFTYFIGSELLGLKLTDTAKNTEKFNLENLYVDGGGVVFVDFETNKGVLQLAVYNVHNGYYGHQVAIRSQQLTFDTVI